MRCSPLLVAYTELGFDHWPLYSHGYSSPAPPPLPQTYQVSQVSVTHSYATYLVLKGQLVAQTWEKAKESVSWSKQIPSLLANPTPSILTVTQASRSLSSLLRGYIRNVKLHQTISAQHPHESQGEKEEEEGGRGGWREVTSTTHGFWHGPGDFFFSSSKFIALGKRQTATNEAKHTTLYILSVGHET